MIRPAGDSARYIRGADGSEALLASDHDRPAWLAVYGPDGRLRSQRELADVLPLRKLAIAAPSFASGLSFSPDGALRCISRRWISTPPIRWRASIATTSTRGRWRSCTAICAARGGSMTPDGRRYVFARANGDHHDLAELDLATGAIRMIAGEPHGAFVAIPRVSPDGTRLVATRFDGHRFRIVLVDARDGRLLATLPTNNEPVHDASWVDDHRVVFLGGAPADAGFQVYDYDLDSGRIAEADGGTVPGLPAQRHRRADTALSQPRGLASGRSTRSRCRRASRRRPSRSNPRHRSRPRRHPPRTKRRRRGGGRTRAAPPAANEATPPAAAGAPAPTGRCDARTRRRADGPGHAAAAKRPCGPVATNIIPPSVAGHAGESTDHLFIPQLYGPTFTAAGAAGDIPGRGAVRRRPDRAPAVGAGGVRPARRRRGQGRRLVRLLEPAARAADAVALGVGLFSFADTPPDLNSNTITSADYTLRRRDSELSVDAERLFYDNPVSLGFAFVESWRPDDPAVLLPLLRIGGPHLSAAYQGAATSPYTGASRLFFASIDAAAYPVSLEHRRLRVRRSARRGGRHRADAVQPASHAAVRPARARLAGAPEGEGLLRIGGYVLQPLARRARTPEIPLTDYPYLPPGALFVEPLRGFEDYPFAVDRIAIGSLTYRLPIIIDCGWASTLGLLPALFVRQVNFDLFAVTAGDGHTAPTARWVDRSR